MKNILTLVIVLALTGCESDDPSVQTGLQGKWVEVTTFSTLTFEDIAGQPTMTLDRGKEEVNGSLQPKSGSGPYDYELLSEDTISLRWVLSSNSNFNQYYFQQSGKTLTIEKFFDSQTPRRLLVFQKVN